MTNTSIEAPGRRAESPHHMAVTLSLHSHPVDLADHISGFRAGNEPRAIISIATPAGDISLHATGQQFAALAVALVDTTRALFPEVK